MSQIPFTVKSYEQIANREKRKGSRFLLVDPELKRLDGELRRVKDKRREDFRTIKRTANKSRRSRLLAECRRQYEEAFLPIDEAIAIRTSVAIREALESLEAAVIRSRIARNPSNDFYDWAIETGPFTNGRETFRISECLERQMAAKQVETQLKKISKTHGKNRHSICAALRDALNRPYKFQIFRFDIKHFFDSIDHEILISQLKHDPRLDSISIWLIESLLNNFKKISGKSRGIPQGIGISSYLAEFYLSNFDKQWQSDGRLAFYARYVDDFVLVSHFFSSHRRDPI